MTSSCVASQANSIVSLGAKKQDALFEKERAQAIASAAVDVLAESQV